MNIITVIGARPQFIKASVISRAIKKFNHQNDLKINESLIHTGQHFDANMSQLFFDQLDIPDPAINLNINGGSHGLMTGRMLIKIERYFLEKKPDLVLVYGDTNSTLSASLAAAKLHIPIAHIEAGLRSFNKKMPEELNRVMVDHISSHLYCPTEIALDNLKKEDLCKKAILSGDVMFDAFLHAQKHSNSLEISKKITSLGNNFILATIHRAENTDSSRNLIEILKALDTIGKNTPIVFPLHPRTKNKIDNLGLNNLLKNLTVVKPLGYLEIIHLLSQCLSVITDSGGLQKEAYFAQKACITIRNETEWIETINTGWNHLVQASSENIIELQKTLSPPNTWPNLYGTGKAGEKIVNHLIKTVFK